MACGAAARSAPTGATYAQQEKVLRGGAYDSKAVEMALTYREKFSPDHGAENRGFRCAKSGPP